MVSLSISQNFQTFYSYSLQSQGCFLDYSWVYQMVLLNLAPAMHQRSKNWFETRPQNAINLVAAFQNLPAKIPSLPWPPTRSLSYS